MDNIGPRFFFDEDTLGVGKAMALLRDDVIHTGHSAILPEVPLGTVDTIWIPEVARRELVVITRDKRIRTRPGERELFREVGLRAFWIGSRNDLSNWDLLVRLARRWDDIEEMVEVRGPGPWFGIITETGLDELPI